jgi:hypothetical protein
MADRNIGKGNTDLAANPIDLHSGDDELLPVMQPLTQLAEVEHVFASREGSLCSVTIIIPRRDEAILGQIFDRELEVIDRAPTLDFDFAVISRDGRLLSDILAPAGELVFSKA